MWGKPALMMAVAAQEAPAGDTTDKVTGLVEINQTGE